MARVTAVQDRSIITLSVLKTFLKVDGDAEDNVLQVFLDSAKRAADTYCENYFTDGSNLTIPMDWGGPTDPPLPIPEEIEAWILARCGRLYERRSEGLSIEQATGIGQSTWAEENYEMLSAYKKNFRI